MPLSRREKIFGPGPCAPMDRNAKIRIEAYARAWNAQRKRKGRPHGPLTRLAMAVFKALLWDFHNSKTGRCFPSYEAIAAKVECARSDVASAIKALEFAEVLTWVNRIVRIRIRERDMFGKWTFRSRVIRTSNAYIFQDPKAASENRPNARFSSKSENRTGTLNQEIQTLKSARSGQGAATKALPTGLQVAWAELEAAFEERVLWKGGGSPVPAD
jgi:hypothetical protein